MAQDIEAQTLSLRNSGAELGRDLAAAYVLATVNRPADRDSKRQMAQIVLREICSAVEKLRTADFPDRLVIAFEHACREACRQELLGAIEAPAAAREAA